MNRLFFVVNYLIFLGMSFLAGTGLMMQFRLPRRSGRAEILGLNRHDWSELHFWGSAFVLLLLATHLWLNRSWFKGVIHKIGWCKFALGLLGAGVVFLIPLVA